MGLQLWNAFTRETCLTPSLTYFWCLLKMSLVEPRLLKCIFVSLLFLTLAFISFLPFGYFFFKHLYCILFQSILLASVESFSQQSRTEFFHKYGNFISTVPPSTF